MIRPPTHRFEAPPVRNGRGGTVGRPAGARLGIGGFTLIELLLVLALLATVLAAASPSLARFFRGRNLDSEAQRFLALTRYGQSRAVAEGIPMVLWIDADEGTYGLEMEATYSEDDRRAVQFEINEDVVVEVEQPLRTVRKTLPQSTLRIAGNLPVLRFTPDGSMAEENPGWVLFREAREGETGELWVSQNRSRLGYEIRTNAPVLLSRR